jgi:hypothetical protein
MDHRPKKSRPSNVVVYVVLSLIGLIGIFLLGQVLQSIDSEGMAPTRERWGAITAGWSNFHDV